MFNRNYLVLLIIAALAVVVTAGCGNVGLVSREGGVEVYEGVQPPFNRTRLADEGDALRVHLVSNHAAVNPTWQQLIDFIRQDKTDQDIYDRVLNPCGAFAEAVYNNAQAKGIRTAFVAVKFKGSNIGHALDAFETTDMGLVYVDCTGMTVEEFLAGYDQQLSPDGKPAVVFGQAASNDKIAYPVVGQKLGFISIEVAQSPSFSYYQQYRARMDTFRADFNECNAAITKYNAYVDEYNRSRNSGLASSISAQKYAINKLTARVTADAEGLGAFWPEMGVVEGMRIYW